MGRRCPSALLVLLTLLNLPVGTSAMDQIDAAIGSLINTTTADDEKRAAEELATLLHGQRIPLNVTVYDSRTGNVVPLSTVGQSSGASLEMELSASSGASTRTYRWRPKQIQNIFILLRE